MLNDRLVHFPMDRYSGALALKQDIRLRKAVMVLFEANTLIGARSITLNLREQGTVLSESTANRLLRQLDELGLTYTTNGRGRGLSSDGRAIAERIVMEDGRVESLDALGINNLEDLRNTLVARRGLEREIVKAVVSNATDSEIASLGEVLSGHDKVPSNHLKTAGFRFHSMLPTLTKNEPLRALGLILFNDRHEHEQLLDIVTASTGGKGTSQHEHRNIFDAIVLRDAAAAETEMVHHLERLIAASEAPMTESAWSLFTATR